jgi:hypothetical protein
MKQGANSAVRFTSYSSLQGVALGYIKPASGKLSSSVTFGLGAIAGLITVCAYFLRIAEPEKLTHRHHDAFRQHQDTYAIDGSRIAIPKQL